ncbi:hypothetical protein BSZ21_34745 [Bradyrhizobium canariense]|uniref:hypothetical protein n=1 Tax=Bradyrhizobium canariense TaxID=255045 RepID=UPI000A194E5F|nr:hypothetical protein [Bradyrhizobium canariense]OSI60623.1 hypothetical protein BSZ21_34745 [Bradyrhizobium canariense]
MQITALGKHGSAKLLSYMPVEVLIKTGGRTALSYLLKPLHDSESTDASAAGVPGRGKRVTSRGEACVWFEGPTASFR